MSDSGWIASSSISLTRYSPDLWVTVSALGTVVVAAALEVLFAPCWPRRFHRRRRFLLRAFPLFVVALLFKPRCGHAGHSRGHWDAGLSSRSPDHVRSPRSLF